MDDTHMCYLCDALNRWRNPSILSFSLPLSSLNPLPLVIQTDYTLLQSHFQFWFMSKLSFGKMNLHFKRQFCCSMCAKSVWCASAGKGLQNICLETYLNVIYLNNTKRERAIKSIRKLDILYFLGIIRPKN